MGYIYQADAYCNECGDSICESLRAAGKAPEDEMDHNSYDSDEFPKSADVENEESDTPAHCAKCEEFMRNPLTSEGYTYVQSALADLPALDSIAKLRAAGRDALADWASWYNFRYWDSEDCEDAGGNRAPGWYSNESF